MPVAAYVDGSGPEFCCKGDSLAGAQPWYAFNKPVGVAISPDNVFTLVIDCMSSCVRRITMATGSVSMFVGSTRQGFADGMGTAAEFNKMMGIAISPDGAYALVTELTSHRIRRIVIATGVVTTFAGSLANSSGYVDGSGLSARFDKPVGVAISPDGVFALVADSGNNCVRRIAMATGAVSTLAGSTLPGSADGMGTAASFNKTTGVAISKDGTYALVSDDGNMRRIVIATGAATTFAGSGRSYSVAISPDDTFALLSDLLRYDIRRLVFATGKVTILAGSPWPGGLGGQYGDQARFWAPMGLAIAPNGRYALVADQGSNVRRIDLFRACEAGYYCPAGAAAQVPCSDGYYCPLWGQHSNASQIPCPGGYACKSNSWGTRRPSECEAGYFCLAGSTSTTQIPCSAAHYCNTTGLSSNATQAQCGEGFYCLAGSSSETPCSAGFYCPAATSSSTQFPCSPGYFCNSTGLSSNATQSICEGGYYCEAGSSSAKQAPCSAGHYCPTGSTSATQVPCSTGYYCNTTGLSSNATQTMCDAGFYCQSGSSSAAPAPCTAGYFCPVGPQIPCKAGYYSESTGLSTISLPLICSSSFYCPAGSTSPTQAACNVPGYYCPAGSSSSMQMACKAGFYCALNYFNSLGAVNGQSMSPAKM